MDQARELISGGINFEEKLINTLIRDITDTEAFGDLDVGKKDKILQLLLIMKEDSIKHKEVLEDLIKTY
ncbi:MAG: hypothetical protein V1838_02255 [Patescibacteria group bacterium]